MATTKVRNKFSSVKNVNPKIFSLYIIIEVNLSCEQKIFLIFCRLQEATVILLDVGQPTGESVRPGQPTFFEQAKQCLAKILQRKVETYILSQYNKF